MTDTVDALGTAAWALRTGGAITADDEALLASQVPELLALAEPPPSTLELELDELAPPDSALTRAATELWREHAPGWLHGHGLRTWYYAAALGRVWGHEGELEADPELLYGATVLHDLGLTPEFGPTAEVPCFAVSGATAARPVVARHRPAPDADAVFEAIAMHLNLRFDEAAPLCQLVSAGTLIDVVGLRLGVLPTSFVAAVNRRHPRGGFGAGVGDALASTAARFPHTRCGWLDRNLLLSTLTRQHPLDQPA